VGDLLGCCYIYIYISHFESGLINHPNGHKLRIHQTIFRPKYHVKGLLHIPMKWNLHRFWFQSQCSRVVWILIVTAMGIYIYIHGLNTIYPYSIIFPHHISQCSVGYISLMKSRMKLMKSRHFLRPNLGQSLLELEKHLGLSRLYVHHSKSGALSSENMGNLSSNIWFVPGMDINYQLLSNFRCWQHFYHCSWPIWRNNFEDIQFLMPWGIVVGSRCTSWFFSAIPNGPKQPGTMVGWTHIWLGP
jgi:hypothetical protein